jgi:hypothetical protein
MSDTVNTVACPLCGSTMKASTSWCLSCGEVMAEPADDLPAVNNRLGQVGFFVSRFGICGVAAVGPFGDLTTFVGIGLTFLSLPGIVLSATGLRKAPRRLAAWGLVIGIAGAMYLTTLCLALFRGL